METVGERLKKGVGWCTIKRFAPGLGAGYGERRGNIVRKQGSFHQDHQRGHGHHPAGEGAGPVPGSPDGGALRDHRHGGQGVLYRQPHPPGVFRCGVRLGHRGLFHPGVQRVSHPEREKGGLPLWKQLPVGDGSAHRGPHCAGHPVRPAPGDPVRGRL